MDAGIFECDVDVHQGCRIGLPPLRVRFACDDQHCCDTFERAVHVQWSGM